MKTAIDKTGRIVVPSEIRRRAGWAPGTELEITLESDGSVRLGRDVPRPRLTRVGRRLVARPAAKPATRPKIDVAGLVEKERDRWPW